MAWKHIGEDRVIDVIVEPNFGGDLVSMAALRPVWIVCTQDNRTKIDESWRVGAALGLFEINRFPVSDPNDRRANLLSMIGVFDDQYMRYQGLVVHGLGWDSETAEALAKEAFRLVSTLPDGFCASLDQALRDSTIGR